MPDNLSKGGLPMSKLIADLEMRGQLARLRHLCADVQASQNLDANIDELLDLLQKAESALLKALHVLNQAGDLPEQAIRQAPQPQDREPGQRAIDALQRIHQRQRPQER